MRAGLLGVLVSLDGVDPHFLGRQARCPEERSARFLAVHVQLCSLPLGEPHALRLGLVLHADLVVGTGLPAVLEQAGDLVPGLGHPPGDGLLVAALHERVGEQRLMPDKRMSSQYEDSDLYSTPNLIRRDILKEPERPRARPRRPPPMAAC